MIFFLKVIFLLGVTLCLTGCGLFQKNISAFERQYLSQRGMNFIENPMEEVSQQHMFNAREGSIGGFGGAGGGCGCN